MPLFFAVEGLDLGDVFFFRLDDIGIDIYCKEVMATTLFSPPTVPRTSLVVLVFFASLALVDGRLLEVLATKYVSRKSVNRPISSRVPLLFFCRLILLKTL